MLVPNLVLIALATQNALPVLILLLINAIDDSLRDESDV